MIAPGNGIIEKAFQIDNKILKSTTSFYCRGLVIMVLSKRHFKLILKSIYNTKIANNSKLSYFKNFKHLDNNQTDIKVIILIISI